MTRPAPRLALHRVRALARPAVPLLVYALLAGSGQSLLVTLLQPAVEHVCACSLEQGHKCKCLKCLGDAHADHEEDDRPALHDEDCSDDEAASRLVKVPAFLPVAVVTRITASPERPSARASPPCPRTTAPPVPPPPIADAHA